MEPWGGASGDGWLRHESLSRDPDDPAQDPEAHAFGAFLFNDSVPARLARGIYELVKFPGDARAGKVDPYGQEALEWAAELAVLLALGKGPHRRSRPVERKGASDSFHYTFERAAQKIAREGLDAGSYATTTGRLSPLQAHIDLALPPNRGLPDAVMRIDLAGLRRDGYLIPEVTRVGRGFNMPGGGFEMRFPYRVPRNYIQILGVIRS